MSRLARDFSGGSQLVVGDVAAIDLVGPMTVHAFVNLDNVTQGAIAAKYTTGGGNGQYLLRASGSAIGFYMIDGAANGHEGFSAAKLTPGVWHSAAGRMSLVGGTRTLHAFLDGESGLAATMPSDNPNSATQLRFGVRSDGGDQLDGRISEIAIWNLDLTDEEILRLSQGWDPRLIRPGNLAGFWPLNDYGSSGGARDISPNQNHATISGSVPLVPGPVAPLGARAILLPFGSPNVSADDAQTVYLDLTPSSADIADIGDVATVYLDLSVISSEIDIRVDSATVYLDLSVLGGECHSTFSALAFGEGEADLQWSTESDILQWSGDPDLQWSFGEIAVEGIHC